jgi:endonuclease/exonuclease/phosphatase family metal-dependent hydrolase
VAADPAPPPEGAIRVATFNAALSRPAPGQLVQEMRLGGSEQIAAVVEIVRRVRPDVLLLTEIDHDPRGVAAALVAEALRAGEGGVDYPHLILAPSNTGLQTGFDLDGDGETGPGDAQGWGAHEGQYGMALFSRFPVGDARTFQRLPWSAMPGNLMPAGHYPPEAEPLLRLSSKSHWDVAVETPAGPLRLLASHPTPPVFDGPERRNARRNHDEIRFWTDYLDGAGWMTDDAGRSGGYGGGPFVLLGDLNADPEDGDGMREAIRGLLAHPALVDPSPASAGGAADPDPDHRGDPALDTAAFRRDRGPGHLRVDYVLPSRDLTVVGAGVFWPAPGDPLRRLVGDGRPVVSSDHRLVWIDVAPP